MDYFRLLRSKIWLTDVKAAAERLLAETALEDRGTMIQSLRQASQDVKSMIGDFVLRSFFDDLKSAQKTEINKRSYDRMSLDGLYKLHRWLIDLTAELAHINATIS